MFLKDRQVSSFGCFVFEFWVLRFRFLRASFSRFGYSIFETWVLCFRDLGTSFSRFGCFVLRSSFSSASFSKLPFVLRSSFSKLPFISPIVWNMCEHLHYELVYFKEIHKEQEYYIQSGGSCSVNYY